MRIAVTGAMGIIGQAVIKRLVRENVSLTCLSRSKHEESSRGIYWIYGDLSDSAIVDELISNQDVIIHLAHDSTPLTTSMDLVAGVQQSVFPSLKLIQAIAASATKPHVIYISSGGALYGGAAGADVVPFRETDACMPVMTYGIHKLSIERYLHNAVENDILRATILRVSNAYGTLLPPERVQGLIGTSISRVLAGKPLRLIGNPENIRDYVHIDDIVSAIYQTLHLESDFEIINVGSGVGYSVLEVLKIVSQFDIDNSPIHIEEVAGSKLLPGWCVLNVDKAHDLLGWEASIPLYDGIAAMFAKARTGY